MTANLPYEKKLNLTDEDKAVRKGLRRTCDALSLAAKTGRRMTDDIALVEKIRQQADGDDVVLRACDRTMKHIGASPKKKLPSLLQ